MIPSRCAAARERGRSVARMNRSRFRNVGRNGMPTSDGRLYGFKYVNGHPKNMREGRQTVTAFGVLADVGNGYPMLLSEMTILTALRTAASAGPESIVIISADATAPHQSVITVMDTVTDSVTTVTTPAREPPPPSRGPSAPSRALSPRPSLAAVRLSAGDSAFAAVPACTYTPSRILCGSVVAADAGERSRAQIAHLCT
mgnify:CR=1 FL=1